MRNFSYVMRRGRPYTTGWLYLHDERMGSFPQLEVIDCIETRKLLIEMQGTRRVCACVQLCEGDAVKCSWQRYVGRFMLPYAPSRPKDIVYYDDDYKSQSQIERLIRNDRETFVCLHVQR